MKSGFDSGWRNIGHLALAWIPYALGLGACVWLGFFMTAHGWFNQLSQEHRRAIYVGAEQRPTSKLKIQTPNEGMLKISRVDLDGSTASIYFTNAGTTKAWSIRIHWQLISPNGTLLSSGKKFASNNGGPDEMRPGDKAEVVLQGYTGIELDNRADSIRFWIDNY